MKAKTILAYGIRWTVHSFFFLVAFGIVALICHELAGVLGELSTCFNSQEWARVKTIIFLTAVGLSCGVIVSFLYDWATEYLARNKNE